MYVGDRTKTKRDLGPQFKDREYLMNYGEAQERCQGMSLTEMALFRRRAIKTIDFTDNPRAMMAFSAGVRAAMERRINRQ